MADNVDKEREKLWAHEYDVLKGIHLDYQKDIPHSVAIFQAYLGQAGGTSAYNRVLDIGCGKGRIGMHLAQEGHEVIGFDCVPSVVEAFEQVARDKGLSERVRVFRQDMNNPWDVSDRWADACFAITVIDNLLTAEQQVAFKGEILRTQRLGALLVIEFYLKEDGYYGPLLEQSPQPELDILHDPINGIAFKLYAKEKVIQLFSPEFRLAFQQEAIFEDEKYDSAYWRRSQVMIFEKLTD